MTDLEVLGVRHHGPGSARSVAGALAELEPDLVVIEGAPELDALLPLAGHPDLVPPVAGLVYAVDAPRRAAFYPLAVFSPEWVALRWALARGVPVRFADLPAAHSLAEHDRAEGRGSDAIATLARVAGYDDPERWWEDAVEHRDSSTLEQFAMIREAMAEVRAGDDDDTENQRREAAMRRVLRASLKEGFARIAVVCGAYHAPVLHPDAFPPATHDNRMLTRLPRTKVAVTWAPWTADRLATASGYGAGVTSPGWYQHLFVTWEQDPAAVVPSWLTRVARALRDEGLPAAPATVVEAVRLAEALAAVRGRPSVGLSELTDATRSVLCEGSDVPLALIDRRLVVGEQLGSVPDETPMIPLARDLDRLQRSLRLKPSPTPTTVVLDLRKESQRDRSVLLHRLRLLGVPWGTPADAGRTTGTFKEGWQLEWRPEFAVSLVEAGLHGTTVVSATTALVSERARDAADLDALGALVEQCFLADLPEALDEVVTALAAATARQQDVVGLLEAIEPLARTRRYGDVRDADTGRVAEVLDTVVARASVDLRPGCASLDDDAATRMRAAVDAAQRGISLVQDEPPVWREALVAVAADDGVHGLVSGRVNRILLDLGVLTSEDAAARLSRRLSVGTTPIAGAAWLDGFLEGDAVLLLHDPELLRIVDEWVTTVAEDSFEDLLPLLRRTFARFAVAERRRLGTRLRQLGEGGPAPLTAAAEWDVERALPAVRRVAELIGLTRG
ncbi:hypothetical protein G5V58_21570 [Nocardioides anomalus]|uniref:Uncharacterized protein n=1 Tax=Nocardioides anomalus TaxID=2712223 RepID=A0A6G6WIP2_9ACTN|nr:DUF5682 family protein [Nocardioides anomalus]QIG45013.1 hypothetical protein G5V58_21570 [Nocardioides anomalus]